MWDTLNRSGKVDVELLKANIDTAVGKVVQVLGPMVEYQTVACKNDLELGGRPFQIIGFDVFVDEKQMPWVVNMTHDPSLKIHFEDEDAIVLGRKAK